MTSRDMLIRMSIVGLFALTLVGCATTPAQTSSTEEGVATEGAKAAFGVRKPKHVGVALMTAGDMLDGDAEQPADEVAIVACGPAIRALADGSELADRVRRGLQAGVAVKACGVTVERMGFDPADFIDGVEVVPNGFVELIRLQHLGYHSVEL